MRQEGLGICRCQMDAYKLQEEGLDTRQANLKLVPHGPAGLWHRSPRMLDYLGIRKLRLMTNNPRKIVDSETQSPNSAIF